MSFPINFQPPIPAQRRPISAALWPMDSDRLVERLQLWFLYSAGFCRGRIGGSGRQKKSAAQENPDKDVLLCNEITMAGPNSDKM